MSGGALAQSIQLFTYPLIARLYLPGDLGALFLFLGIISVSVTVFTLQLEGAVLAARKSHTRILFYVAFWLLFTSAAFFLLLFWVIGDWILATFKLPLSTQEALWYFPLGLITHGIYALSVSAAIRQQQYSRLAISHLTIALSTVTIQVSLGYFAFGIDGLLIGDLVSRSLGLAILNSEITSLRPKKFKKSLLIRVLRNYKRFPLYLAPAATLNVLSQNLQSICFPIFFGVTQAGYLGLANKLISAPVGLTASAASHVFTGELAANASTDSEQRKIVLDALTFSTTIALPLLSCFLLASESFFSLAFGDKWELSGTYAAILSLGIASSLVVSPISNLVVIKNSLSIAFYFSILELVVRSFPYFLVWVFNEFSALMAVCVISMGNVVLYGVGLIRFSRLVGIGLSDYFARVRPLLAPWALCFAPMAIGYALAFSPFYLFSTMLIGLSCYSAYAYRRHRKPL